MAHGKKPIVIVGSGGPTAAVLKEIDSALAHHELIKIRVNADDRAQRQQLIDRIGEALGAELVQRLGHVATLFRRNPEAPRIALP